MLITLDVAVPMWIDRLRSLSFEERAKLAGEAAQMVAEHGDDLQFGSKKPGRAADAFNALARGLALCSFQPGGVKFADRHWETK